MKEFKSGAKMSGKRVKAEKKKPKKDSEDESEEEPKAAKIKSGKGNGAKKDSSEEDSDNMLEEADIKDLDSGDDEESDDEGSDDKESDKEDDSEEKEESKEDKDESDDSGEAAAESESSGKSNEDEESEQEEEEVKAKPKAKGAPEKKEKVQAPRGGNSAELYVGSLPFEATKEQIKEYFSEYGEVVSINMLQRNGKYSGRSFVVFKNTEDADKALVANGKEFQGRPLVVRKANDFPAPKESKPAPASPNRVFVVNIPFDATEDRVKEFFAKCGKIQEVKMVTRSNGKSRGFAFVEFGSEESAKKALELSGKELDGREIKVSPAEAKKDQAPKGGRGGFRGSRGGFRGGRGGRGGFRGERRGSRGRGGFRGNKRGRFE
eukprot:TRINITY_DN2591_c0_g1_i3.p1 TRINITY_DN2591_c0_g1~~TRINITY_DN2591_c0_g1_i3.p1  ORF type:complete len:378 (+),score=140.12 TRINITY_DN2591_c0_g1_i3:312-1445(+)